MWQRFTEPSRRVVFFAQEEAGRLGENSVSTEHLLLGLVRENDSVAARILDRIGVSLGRVRSEIERQVARGDGRMQGDMQLTPRAKRVIDFAYDEARQLNNNYMGTEHLLLGLIREGEGLAGRVLKKLGVDLERTREEVQKLQAENPSPARERDKEEASSEVKDALLAEDALLAAENAVAAAENALSNAKAKTREMRKAQEKVASWTLPAPPPGVLGIVKHGTRDATEVALDAHAFIALNHVFAAKDAHGYRQMASGDQTMFLLPVGTPLKCLVPTGDGAFDATRSGGLYVRVLSGPYDGYAGWIDRDAFNISGPDIAAFPPSIGDGE